MALAEYLQYVKSQVSEIETVQCIHVVIGNEACDLDSAVSAIVYAYFLHKISPDSGTLYVPVLNIGSAEYRLRTEVAYALSLYDINSDLLVFRDQINLTSLQQNKKLELTLVDFNVFRGEDVAIDTSVVEIIDHHKQERDGTTDVAITLEMVGSCATLITEKLLSQSDFESPKDALWLLYGTILLDTVCLSESAGRATAKDIEYIEKLENLLPKTNRRSIFDKLQAAKFDVSSLTTIELLNKDLKVVRGDKVSVAISSLPIDIKDFLARDDLETSIDSFSCAQAAAVVVVMCLVVDEHGEPHRQLAVYAKDTSLRDQVTTYLQDAKHPELLLGGNIETCHLISAFPQGNVQASRKQILPLISQYLQAMDAKGDRERNEAIYEEPMNREGILSPQEMVTPISMDSDHLQFSGDEKYTNALPEAATGNGDSANNLLDFDPIKTLPVDDQLGQDKSPSVNATSYNEKTDSNTCISSDLLDAFDPFSNETNIILEKTPDNTTSVTPASGLSSRSYSPNMDNMEASKFTSGLQSGINTAVTPVNSPIGIQRTSQDIPSREDVVEKIKQKVSLSGAGDSYPHTPVNSYADLGNMDQITSRVIKGDFSNSELVEKIEEMKMALGGITEEKFDSDEDFIPPVPQNSYADNNIKLNKPVPVQSLDIVQKFIDMDIAIEDDTEKESKHMDDVPHEHASSPQNETDCFAVSVTKEREQDKPVDKLISLDDNSSSDPEEMSSTDKYPKAPPSSFAESSLWATTGSAEQHILNEQDVLYMINIACDEESRENSAAVDFSLAEHTAQEEVAATEVQLNDSGSLADAAFSDRGENRGDFGEPLIMQGDSEEEVAYRLLESVMQKASEEYQRQVTSQDPEEYQCQEPEEYQPQVSSQDPEEYEQRSDEIQTIQDSTQGESLLNSDNIHSPEHSADQEFDNPRDIQGSDYVLSEQSSEDSQYQTNSDLDLDKPTPNSNIAEKTLEDELSEVGESPILETPCMDNELIDDVESTQQDRSIPTIVIEEFSSTVEEELSPVIDHIPTIVVEEYDSDSQIVDSEDISTLDSHSAEKIHDIDSETLPEKSFVEEELSPDSSPTDGAIDIVGITEQNNDYDVDQSEHSKSAKDDEEQLIEEDYAINVNEQNDLPNNSYDLNGMSAEDDTRQDTPSDNSINEFQKTMQLGPEPGESHTEDNQDPEQIEIVPRQQARTETEKTMEDQITDGVLQLGTDPGESYTDPTCSLTKGPQPDIIPEKDPVISSGMVLLGSDPGESSTDDKSAQHEVESGLRPNEHGELNNVHAVDSSEFTRCSPEGSPRQREPEDSVGREPPEGSSSQVIQEGSTSLDQTKPDDGKLTEQQRSHLEGVRKALDIDLDLSSDDEEETKTQKDQIPEQAGPASTQVQRPSTLDTSIKKKIVPNLDLLNDTNYDIASSPISTDEDIGISIDDEKTPDDLTTPDVLNSSMFDGELDWGSRSGSQTGSSVTPVEPIPEYTAREEFEDERHWKSVQIGDRWYKIDMKVIEPYKKVLSHGGYYGDGFNAIVVFSACYLPDRRRRDYHYVMDNLFVYCISTLELLVVEDYMIVYFHGATPKHKMPSLRWLKRCYDMIDRRLRKNLKRLLIVHPTVWLKTLMLLTKPFISSKFSSKLHYIKNLDALTKAVCTEYIYVPEEVKHIEKNPPKKKFVNM